MPLDDLRSWDSTRDSLHRAARVVGQIRKTRVSKQPNALHLALFVTENGLTTGPLEDGSWLELCFAAGVVRGQASDGRFISTPLEGQSAAALWRGLAEALDLEPVTPGSLNEPETAFEFNAAQAGGYADALNAVYTGLARFRARLSGMMTPLVVWPHGFDLSGLWFSGPVADEHAQPHINLGFSPGSPGLPRPYLYAYAWPWPTGIEDRPLPGPARWHNDGWKGALLDYDEWRNADHPARAIEQTAADFFTTLTAR